MSSHTHTHARTKTQKTPQQSIATPPNWEAKPNLFGKDPKGFQIPGEVSTKESPFTRGAPSTKKTAAHRMLTFLIGRRQPACGKEALNNLIDDFKILHFKKSKNAKNNSWQDEQVQT